MRIFSITPIAFIAASLLWSVSPSGAQSGTSPDPNRGLWVGEIKLSHVNEVSVPLDESNIPIAPIPQKPTPTFDAANLRLILHVNGSGQVSLLKEVALLSRKDEVLRSENDFSLVTDERLYGEFPPQPAVRIASAAFDFGDPQATGAVTAVVDATVDAVYGSISGLSAADLDTVAERDTAQASAIAAATAAAAAPSVVSSADAASSFFAFRTRELPLGVVDAIAAEADPNAFVGDAGDTSSLRGKAKALADGSFYGDGRALAMIDAIVDAVLAAPESEREAEARKVASSYADLTNQYQRFIAGESFGDMISAAASAAAEIAKALSPSDFEALEGSAGQNPITVVSAGHGLESGDSVIVSGSPIAGFDGVHVVEFVDEDRFSVDVSYEDPDPGAPLGAWLPYSPIEEAATAASFDAATEAAIIEVADYDDNRASEAIGVVLDALIPAAADAAFQLPGASEDARFSYVVQAAEEAARTALDNEVERYSLPMGVPSTDYTDFVRSDTYQNSPDIAAAPAAEAAIFELANNILATEASIKGKARAAAMMALDPVFSAAARSAQTELPVAEGPVGGGFGAGKGDARLAGQIGDGDPALGGPALEAEIVLAANHPTNPFRHRRHPDHTVGFEIVRRISFDFDDEDTSPNPRAGFGVDRLTGIYREEIFGLHKPLGPEPEDDPVGLRVEGRFDLQRVSLIDTLNAR